MFVVTYRDKNNDIKYIYSKDVYENSKKLEEKLRNGLKLDEIISIKEEKDNERP